MIYIPIYKVEAAVDGLMEKICANASVAYCVQVVQPLDIEKPLILEGFAQANTNEDLELGSLYPTKSVLVTTSWNINDDVFGPMQTWAARKTPVNKPTNVGHDETKIVGHMVNSWVIDDDGKLVDDDTIVGELPAKFHLCNGAVIYTHWKDKALTERTDTLIEQIEAQEMFVSMECLFTDFDYAIRGENDDFRVIARNEKSAFLTKHLRAYGGSGVYDNYKIGRFLKNIAFSGKGYVTRPANSESIIFSHAQIFDFMAVRYENPFLKGDGVCIQQQLTVAESQDENMELTMSEITQEKLDSVTKALDKATARCETLTKALAEVDEEKHAEVIKTLEDKTNASDKALETASAALTTSKASVAEAEAKNVELTKTNEELTKQVAETKASELRVNRISLLVDGGVAKDVAEAKVELFANLDDEQFKAVAEEIVKSFVPPTSEEGTSGDAGSGSEGDSGTTADEIISGENGDALNNAEVTNEINASVGSETNGSDDLIASISKKLSQKLGHSQETNDN